LKDPEEYPEEESPGPEPKDFNEAEESPESDDADESHAVMVVVTVTGSGGTVTGATVVPDTARACKRPKASTDRIMVLW
jgi:hypothetical protein